MSNLSYTIKKRNSGTLIGDFSISIQSYDETIEIKRKINYYRNDLSYRNYYINLDWVSIRERMIVLNIFAYDPYKETYDDIAELEKIVSKKLGLEIKNISLSINADSITESTN